MSEQVKLRLWRVCKTKTYSFLIKPYKVMRYSLKQESHYFSGGSVNENDKRDKSLVLAYSGTPFSVPSNLYIIGMMNTADRSLAMIDYALRRRFSFFSMEPGFDTDGFKAYQQLLDNETFNDLIEQIKSLNTQIETDGSLGKGFCIGHSYFCGRRKETCTDEWMQSVVNYDIIPMLEEYWFDDDQKVKQWSTNLNEVFNG